MYQYPVKTATNSDGSMMATPMIPVCTMDQPGTYTITTCSDDGMKGTYVQYSDAACTTQTNTQTMPFPLTTQVSDPNIVLTCTPSTVDSYQYTIKTHYSDSACTTAFSQQLEVLGTCLA